MMYLIAIGALLAFVVLTTWIDRRNMRPEKRVFIPQENVDRAAELLSVYARKQGVEHGRPVFSDDFAPVSTTQPYDFDFDEAPTELTLGDAVRRVLEANKAWDWAGIPMSDKTQDEFVAQFNAYMDTPQGKFMEYCARKGGV